MLGAVFITGTSPSVIDFHPNPSLVLKVEALTGRLAEFKKLRDAFRECSPAEQARFQCVQERIHRRKDMQDRFTWLSDRIAKASAVNEANLAKAKLVSDRIREHEKQIEVLKRRLETTLKSRNRTDISVSIVGLRKRCLHSIVAPVMSTFYEHMEVISNQVSSYLLSEYTRRGENANYRVRRYRLCRDLLYPAKLIQLASLIDIYEPLIKDGYCVSSRILDRRSINRLPERSGLRLILTACLRAVSPRCSIRTRDRLVSVELEGPDTLFREMCNDFFTPNPIPVGSQVDVDNLVGMLCERVLAAREAEWILVN